MAAVRVLNRPTKGIPYGALSAPVARAQGAWVVLADGTRLLDLANTYGAVLLGHGHPAVTRAVIEVVAAGAAAVGGHPIADRVAARLLAATGLNGAGVAFFKTGTAAVRAVTEAFRRALGRSRIASAGYHGWDPMWSAPPAPFVVNAHGVYDCLYVPSALASFLEAHPGDVAALVVAPDFTHLPAETLISLFDIARRAGVPVIADEVKLGFRLSPGPSIRTIGLEADAYVYGKAIANGSPLNAVVARPPVADLLADATSTLTFEGTALAACEATLRVIEDEDVFGGLSEAAGRLRRGLDAQLRGRPFEVVGRPEIFQIVAATPELEAGLYDAAAGAGLLLYRGDNQTPSWAIREAVDEALARFEGLFARFEGGGAVDDHARRRAAWSQMDGFVGPDDMALAEGFARSMPD